jgi:hypothetical protein
LSAAIETNQRTQAQKIIAMASGLFSEQAGLADVERR